MNTFNFLSFWNAVNSVFPLQQMLFSVSSARKHPHYPDRQLLITLVTGLCCGFSSLLRFERKIPDFPLLRHLAGFKLADNTPTADTLRNFAHVLSRDGLHQALTTIWRRLHQIKALPGGHWVALDGSGMCQQRRRTNGPVLGVAAALVGGSVNGLLRLTRRPSSGDKSGELTHARLLLAELADRFSFLSIRGVVVDALYCNGPFFRAVRERGWHVVCRLKRADLHVFQDALGLLAKGWSKSGSDLLAAKERWYRWEWQEVDGLTTFPGLDEPVRVIRLRQGRVSKRGEPLSKPEEHWLVTTLSRDQMPAADVLGVMRSRWDIEVDEFRELKHEAGLEWLAPSDEAACEALWLLAAIVQVLLRWWVNRHCRLPKKSPKVVLWSEVREELYVSARWHGATSAGI